MTPCRVCLRFFAVSSDFRSSDDFTYVDLSLSFAFRRLVFEAFTCFYVRLSVSAGGTGRDSRETYVVHLKWCLRSIDGLKATRR